MADHGVGRVEPDLAGVGLQLAGQHPQQGRLAGAVGPDQPDHVTGGDDQVEAGEQRPICVAGGEVTGEQGGGHRGSLPGGPTVAHGFRSDGADVLGVQSPCGDPTTRT